MNWKKTAGVVSSLAIAGALMVRGARTPALVGNLVWNDLNRNGIQDRNEPGINGVTVKAYNATNDQLIATQITQSNGADDGIYSFTLELPVAVYIQIELPGPFTFTTSKQGGNDALDSDVDRLTGRTVPILLDRTSAGRIHANWDAGLAPKLYEGREMP